MTFWALFLIFTTSSVAAVPATPEPVNCGCNPKAGASHCGVQPAFMAKSEVELSRALGFEAEGEDLRWTQSSNGLDLYRAFAGFLEKSDRAFKLNPEYYTRAANNASALTLKTKFVPKNPSEADEYLRCTIPADKYCLYKNSLRPYIGLAAKTSGIPFSFLACQSYVESRFNRKARSNVGAIGYAQIKETNVHYLNEVLARSIRRTSGRTLASVVNPRSVRVNQAQQEIARIWKEFWIGTKKAPTRLAKCDLTCYRQVFLAQALSLKTDMLALATSSSGIRAGYDDDGDFRIENMDKQDSLLVLAGSYNVGVTNMIRLISRFCPQSTKLKDCLDRMQNGVLIDAGQERARQRDVPAFQRYIMRIRDCSQRFSAEQIDFDDDDRWTDEIRLEKRNEQRDQVVQCLLNPCKRNAI
jgi:hypothetical protein